MAVMILFFALTSLGILLLWLGVFSAHPLKLLAKFLDDLEAKAKARHEEQERQKWERRKKY